MSLFLTLILLLVGCHIAGAVLFYGIAVWELAVDARHAAVDAEQSSSPPSLLEHPHAP